jgi:hypothetical protein
MWFDMSGIGEVRNLCRIVLENLKVRDYLGNLGVDSMVILKLILKLKNIRDWNKPERD